MIALLLAAPVRASTLFDPALRFRTIRTPHFVIHFHQGEDRLAGRLAVVAEEVWRALEQPLARRRRSRTSSSPISPSAPAEGPLPCPTTRSCWMRRGRPARISSGTPTTGSGWCSATSSRTSRTWIDRRAGRASPGTSSDACRSRFRISTCRRGRSRAWRRTKKARSRAKDGCTTETSARSRKKPRGRVRWSASIASTAASWTGLAGRPPYAYGAGFHQYLAERFGPEKLAALAERDGPARAVHRFAGVPAHLREVARGVVERLSRPAVAQPRRPGTVRQRAGPADAPSLYGRRPPVRSIRVCRLPAGTGVLGS